MAEKLRRGGPAGETEDQIGDRLFIILSIYILSIQFIYILSIQFSISRWETGARPVLYNQLMHIFYREVCRKGEADTGGTFGHCRRANRETVEAFSL